MLWSWTFREWIDLFGMLMQRLSAFFFFLVFFGVLLISPLKWMAGLFVLIFRYWLVFKYPRCWVCSVIVGYHFLIRVFFMVYGVLSVESFVVFIL